MIEEIKQGLLNAISEQRENVDEEKRFDLPAWTHQKSKFLNRVQDFIENYQELPKVVFI